MSPTPKINLSAMVKKKETDKSQKPEITENTELEVKTEIETEKTETTKEKVEKKEVQPSLMPKISLSSIKTNKSVTEIKEEKAKETVDEHVRKKEELLEVLDIEPISSETINEKVEDNGADNKIESTIIETKVVESKEKNPNEESIEEIEKKINEKVEEEVNKKLKKTTNTESSENKEVDDDKKELFGNYKSEFIEKESTIIENVETEKKRFRDRLKEPKTRVLLLLSLIVLTIGGIFTLFKIDPENHSVEIYKNIITNNIKSVKSKYLEKPWVLSITTIDGYNFNTYTQSKIIKGYNYKYNDIVYNSKEELNKILNTELTVIKQEAERKRIEEEKVLAEKAKEEQDKSDMLAKIEAEKLKTGTGETTVETQTGIIIETIPKNTIIEPIQAVETTIEDEQKKVEKNRVTKEKIKTILHDKYKDLILKYQQ